MLQGAGARWNGFSVDTADIGTKDALRCTDGGANGFPELTSTRIAVSKPTLLNRRKKTIVKTGTNSVTGEGAYGAGGTATITTKFTLTRR